MVNPAIREDFGLQNRFLGRELVLIWPAIHRGDGVAASSRSACQTLVGTFDTACRCDQYYYSYSVDKCGNKCDI